MKTGEKVEVGVKCTYLGPILKFKGSSDFLVTFYINKHKPKKLLDFMHFPWFAPPKTEKFTIV